MEYPGSLHNHTHYSNIRLRDCIVKPEDLIDYAIKLGHKGVAITDHESISGHIKVENYYKKIKETNPDFKVILGNEIYLCRNGLNNETFIKGQDKYYHFILLAKDAIGHKQIREISTRAWIRSYVARRMRRVPTYYQDLFDIIGADPGHVIASTACLGGALPTQILRSKDLVNEEKEKLLSNIKIWCEQLSNLFGKENFFLELQPNNCKEQIYVNNELIKLGKELGLRWIITTDTHYLKKEDREIHKAYLNSQNGDREVDDFYATTYLMDTKELESYLKIEKEDIKKAYENIEWIFNECEDYSLMKPLKIPKLKWVAVQNYLPTPMLIKWFEKIPMLETFILSSHESDRYLVWKIIDGIRSHDDLQNKEAYDEINLNLEMTWQSSQVNKAEWSAYYLNLQNIIETCWKAGTLVGPGRGSGVGFILLYVLGITQINPLRETTRCFPWRFINPERVSVLDVDFDIESGRRADVLRQMRLEYGYDRVTNVATFRLEKSKSAILTAARGLGIDVDIAQYISSLIPADRGQLRTLHQCYYGDEEQGWNPVRAFVNEMQTYPELWKVAQKIEGIICGSGVHAGGIIFVDEPFTETTALMRAPDGTLCTQFDLHDAEATS